MMPEKKEHNDVEATGEETLKLHRNFTCVLSWHARNSESLMKKVNKKNLIVIDKNV